MPLKAISIHNIRNLQQVDLDFSPGLNLFYGDNGAGKTSILEAISYTGLGRSFKTRVHKYVIGGLKHKSMQVVSKGYECPAESESPFIIKVIRSTVSKNNKAFVNSEAVQHSSELADQLPMQWIDTDSYNLISGPSSYRRSYIDWIMFHVKHNFRALYSQYMACLKQRNALLRRDKITPADIKPWNEQLASLGEAVDTCRQESLENLFIYLIKLVEEAGFIVKDELSISYIRGWNDELSLHQSLIHQFDSDLIRGHTQSGPHRADIGFKVKGKPILESTSRGQQKTLVYALIVAQIHLVTKMYDRNVLCLLDDLPAELDRKNRFKLMNWLESLNLQCFVTGINSHEIIEGWSANLLQKAKLFHVKHGEAFEEPIIGEIHDR